ncbi:hypothetical protein PVT67_04050 [Gallaecimonas kandeliae]|uniref:hypothetical protein n=1 Tax=Gallaecimonas kandeliae TaxID=3029055 RepID=UPI002648DC72|nr:hypothetical protein [Gallaecimonas kandeliae]WKE66434.1 hypothetical protein PVT67_04050 [Gallaecimonas kandeliae]
MLDWTITMATLVLGILAFLGLRDNGLPKAYQDRNCQGAQWRQAFPQASKDAIRRFLGLFTDAFAIGAGQGLKLSPEDPLLAIYRARYPSRMTPDVMEFETLAADLARHHGLQLSALWHEGLTLGELFQATRPKGVGKR